MFNRDPQTPIHRSIIAAISALELPIDDRGMCEGYAVAAANANDASKLAEFDRIINSILELNEAVESSTPSYSENYNQDYKNQFNALFSKLEPLLQEEIFNLLSKISKFHAEQFEEDPFAERQTILMKGIYNEEDLLTYFNSLQNEINSRGASSPGLTLLLRSSQHTIMMAAIPDEPMIIREINKPHLETIPLETLDDAQEILQSLVLIPSAPESGYSFCKTTLIIPKSHPELLPILEQWQESESMQAIHGPDKVGLTGDDGGSLLIDAVQTHNQPLVEEFFEKYPELEREDQAAKALFFSIFLNHEDTMRFLLNKNMNFNFIMESSLHRIEMSLLETAIKYGRTEAAHALLDKPKIDTNKLCMIDADDILKQAESREAVNEIQKLFYNLFQVDITSEAAQIEFPLLYLSAFLGQEKIVEKLVDLSPPEALFSTDFKIGPDELANMMNYPETAKTITSAYRNKTLKTLSELKIRDEIYQSALQVFSTSMEKVSLNEQIKLAHDFIQLSNLVKNTAEINNADFSRASSNLLKNYINGNVDKNEMRDLISKVKMFNALNTKTGDNIKLSAIQNLKTIITSISSQSQIESAYKTFEKISKLEHYLIETNKSRFGKKADPNWFVILNNCYTKFSNTRNGDYTELNQVLDQVLQASYVSMVLQNKPSEKFSNILKYQPGSEIPHLNKQTP